MRISESDWNVFLGHAAATLAKFQVPEAEQREVVHLSRVSRKTSSNSFQEGCNLQQLSAK
jgi:hypothetical protein